MSANFRPEISLGGNGLKKILHVAISNEKYEEISTKVKAPSGKKNLAKFASEVFAAASAQFKLRPLGPLKFALVHAAKNELPALEIEFESLPEISLPKHPENISVNVEEAIVQPGEIRAITHNLLRSRGGFEPVPEVRHPLPGDIITVDLLYKSGGKTIRAKENFSFQWRENGRYQDIARVAARLLKGQTGKEILSGNGPSGTPIEMIVRLRDIRKEILPEMDDDFARSCGMKSLKELHEAIYRKSLSVKLDMVKKAAQETLLDSLMANVHFPVSENLAAHIRRQLARTAPEMEFAENSAHENHLREIARKLAARQMFLMAAAYENNLDVSDKEVEDYFLSLRKQDSSDSAPLYEAIINTDAAYYLRDMALAQKGLEFLYFRARKIIVDKNGRPVSRPGH